MLADSAHGAEGIRGGPLLPDQVGNQLFPVRTLRQFVFQRIDPAQEFGADALLKTFPRAGGGFVSQNVPLPGIRENKVDLVVEAPRPKRLPLARIEPDSPSDRAIDREAEVMSDLVASHDRVRFRAQVGLPSGTLSDE